MSEYNLYHPIFDPYAYAADFVRQRTRWKISQAEAAKIYRDIADAIGIDHRDMAIDLSIVYQRENNIRRPEDVEQKQ